MSIEDKIANAKALHLEDWNNGYSEGYQQGRKDAIEEVYNKAFCEFSICEDCAMFGQYDEYGEKEVCILLKLKEQTNEQIKRTNY